MKIVQIEPEKIRESSVKNLRGSDIYRITVCDDGNYGKSHLSARLKSVNTISIEDILASVEDPNCAFIQIILEE